MGQFDYIFFDLDGTMIDSGDGITLSVQYALKKMGIIEKELSALKVFVGPPLKDSFMYYYGFSDEEAEKAISYYRIYYESRGILRCWPYKRVEKLLSFIENTGRKAVIATSKPELFARRIVQHLHMSEMFEYIAGASMDGKIIKKSDVIAYAMKEIGADDPSRILMVGDRKYDVIGARANGIKTAGVLYGYGSYPELLDAGADYIAQNVSELAEVISI
ncbi:MAG: HAD hydrolase-like protein [Oscillospiraceae bacterium]